MIAPTSAADPFETHHVTRDGRLLDVEVWTRSINFGGQPAELVFAVDVTERRALGRALVDAISSEQRRIGQEMHDGLGQELTGLALSARALANRAARERDAIAGDLDQLALLATSCIHDARLIVQGLSPLTDADGSLEAALEALARNSSLSDTPVRFRVRHDAPRHRRPQGAQSPLSHCSGGRAERPQAFRRERDRHRSLFRRAEHPACRQSTTAAASRARVPAEPASGSACAPCAFGPAPSAADSQFRAAPGGGNTVGVRSAPDASLTGADCGRSAPSGSQR